MKILMLLFLFYHSYSSGQAQNWVVVGNMNKAVKYAEAVTTDSTILIIGGKADSLDNTVQWIQAFNPKKLSWEMKGNLKYPRRNFSSGIYNDNVYAFGGYKSNNHDTTSYLETFPLANPIPSIYSYHNYFVRKDHAGHIYNGKYYVFGGFIMNGGHNSPFIFEFDIQTKKITYYNDSIYRGSIKPQGIMIERVGSIIYLFGGEYNGISRNIYKYNTNLHVLQKLSIQLAVPRAYGRAVKVPNENKIYIIGGFNEQYSALNTVEVFTVDSTGNIFTLTSGPKLNQARAYFTSVLFDSCIWVLGGTASSGSYIKTMEKLTVISDVRNEKANEFDFNLEQNYPNPFNPATKITYHIAKRNFVTLKVFDILGKEIYKLVNEEKEPGKYEVEFPDVETGQVFSLSSGVYFYQLKAGNLIQTKKMVLLR